MQTEKCETLVIGAGIAGICAALKASELGSDVMIATRDRVCSGSSFWGSTWGLGLIGPYDDTEESIEDFVDEICSVGQQVAVRDLVEKLVRGVAPGLAWLESKGFVVREPSEEARNDRTYVPCFDHKVRGWHGLATHESVDALRRSVDEAGIIQLEKSELVDLLVDSCGSVCGAVFLQGDALVEVRAKAVVLATGGMSGLFEGHLSADDSDGSASALALLAGAKLANIEFLQQMVAYETPVGPVVFNEKLWRETRLLEGSTGQDAFAKAGWSEERSRPCFEAHAWHGPFTAVRDSRYIEALISHVNESDRCLARVDIDLDAAPEFVRVYADWLMGSHGMDLCDPHPVYVAMQASNGGILVDENGWTGVDGLYAAGEATGGYHGADRIGGLASATALVSGLAAGEGAACSQSRSTAENIRPVLGLNGTTDLYDSSEMTTVRHEATRALVGSRASEDLLNVASKIRELLNRYVAKGRSAIEDARVAAGNANDCARLLSMLCIVEAALRREETRGPHYRVDHPTPSSDFERMLSISKDDILGS